MISRVPYSERSERRDVLKTLTLKDVLAYRDSLLVEARLELLVVGNMNERQVSTLASALKQFLGCSGVAWWHGEEVMLDKHQVANLQRAASSTDSALAAVYVPTGYDKVVSMAYSALLGQIIQPWFYSQLRIRIKEQLGYALFAFPISVGRQWGVGFLLQSNSKQPAYLYQRYQDFYLKTEKSLREMSDADFQQYQQALINELKQRPQTLGEEASRFANDFDRSNFAFDTRQKLIVQVMQLTAATLAGYFHQAVIQPKGLALLSQLSGSGQDKADYAEPKGWVTHPNASALQKVLLRKVAIP